MEQSTTFEDCSTGKECSKLVLCLEEGSVCGRGSDRGSEISFDKTSEVDTEEGSV